jgi:serine/threonine protein kinase
MISKTLGHYQIISEIGKGGMGEVYQAKDQKLGRDVAIKVLPDEFARDADRVARFQREAKVLASLNHPNIAAIHGLEESGGTNFLVLELVEGETLADQLKRGPIPVEASLKLALQLAEALEAAHEKGIVHRDLKPANIKVTAEGKVKVLDFGLAKAFTEDREASLSNSPTLSDAATQQGILLGTAAYMSPEQAKGKTVDKRADIFAFGVVLFEMLTGQQLFKGDTVSETLAAVLMREPEWNRLPPNLHPRIRLLLERCLEKETRSRYGSINDALVDIQKVLADPSGIFAQPITIVGHQKKLRTILPWVAALILIAIIVGVAVWELKPPEPRRVMRFTYELPECQQFSLYQNSDISLAVSPDGNQFVYGTTEGLYLRSVDALDARLIAGTDKNSFMPFFSPDGQWIGYWSKSERKLKKIAVSGGAPVVLCDTGILVLGASWNSDNTIVYSDILSGIMRISANGGTSESLIKGGTADVKRGFPATPQMLPDGKTLLLTDISDMIIGNGLSGTIAVQSLKSEERKVLQKGGYDGIYISTGHLVYFSSNDNVTNLLAAPFNLDRLEITGGSVSVLGGVSAAAVSDSGTLIYVLQPRNAAESRNATSSGSPLVWVNRQGKEEPLAAAPNSYDFRISPDGTRVALTVDSGTKSDIWIYDLARETTTRLTFNEGHHPLWTHDGKRIIYSLDPDGTHGGIYWKASDGTGDVRKIDLATDRILIPFSMSKDGKTFVLEELVLHPIQTDIGMMSMNGDPTRKPLLQGKYDEYYPKISPDGRWLAYASNESGKSEVYVRPFPEVESGGRWQVSTNGGDSPLWSPDNRELFYRSGDSFMAVEVETAPVFKPGKPKLLFKGNYYSESIPTEFTMWDISPDGKRFLMIKPPASTGAAPTAATPRKINIVLNWFEELKQRVPHK